MQYIIKCLFKILNNLTILKACFLVLKAYINQQLLQDCMKICSEIMMKISSVIAIAIFVVFVHQNQLSMSCLQVDYQGDILGGEVSPDCFHCNVSGPYCNFPHVSTCIECWADNCPMMNPGEFCDSYF